MGSYPSGLSGSKNVAREPQADENLGGSIDDDRPSKRRRISSDGSNIKTKRPSTVTPSRFYGSSGLGLAKPPIDSIVQRVAANDPPEFRKALRIDILGIIPKGEEPEFVLEQHTIDIKCSVSIFWATTEKTQDGVIRKDDYEEVCRSAMLGKLEVQAEENGEITRRIILPRPFIFSSEEFFVGRNKDFSRRPDTDGFYYTYDLADAYRIQVTLDPGVRQENWPPLALGDIPLRKNLQMEGRSLLLVKPERQQRALPLSVVYNSQAQPVPYLLQLHFKWSFPQSLIGLMAPPPNSDSVRHPLKDTKYEPNQLLERSTGESRARRARVVDTYNLKTLSAQAQGKSPRKRKARESIDTEADADTGSSVTISYSFGRADSADNGVKQQHTFTGLACPFCDCSHTSLDQLRFHLHHDHDNFKFHLRRENPSRICYFVEVVRNRTSMDGRTFQLGKPTTLFNLEKYLNGDNSWIRAREGPHHNHWPDHLTSGRDHTPLRTSDTTGREQSLLSSSVQHSRHSSPNTSSRSIDDMDIDNVSKAVSKLELPKRKALFVPNTVKPLYHTITKRLLQPGEDLPSSDDEKDESWFHQKHRDMINDFEDVDADEKEYLNKWNPFAMDVQHTTDVFLPSTILNFVETNKAWFGMSPNRRQKFMTHMAVLVLRGVVKEKFVSKCVKIIRDAEMKMRDEDMAMEEEEEILKHRGMFDCVCLEHAPLQDRVVCVGENCQGRFFHKACAFKLGVPEARRGKWKCNVCLEQDDIS